jgi:hypothetical protein
VDNANCLLDAADLVFLDPVGTGYSKVVGDGKGKDFWGIDEDAKSLAQFITTFVNRNNRWNSPKFLIGESYGTFRDAVLVDYLQNHEDMYFNGIVMISTVLDFESLSFNPGEDLSYVLYLPSYAAAAWYQKTLADRPADLTAFLSEARQFASTDYATALAKGSTLPAAERAEIVKKLAHFTGLSEDYISNANLRVSLPQFMSELQRSKGLTIGRYDARFSGPIYDPLEEYAAYDPQSAAVDGACARGSTVQQGSGLPDAELSGERGLGLGPQSSGSLYLAGTAKCRGGFGGRHDYEHAPSGRSRKRIVRSSDAVFRDRIHHGSPQPAGQFARQHSSAVLRRRSHDVSARGRPHEIEGQHRGVHRERVETLRQRQSSKV